MVIAGHQLMTIASTVNATLMVPLAVTELTVLHSLLALRDKNELSKTMLVAATLLSAETLSVTVLNAITTFQNVIIVKTLLLYLMTAAVVTNASATSTSAQTSVTVHVQKDSNESFSQKNVAQLPSAYHANTLLQLHLLRQHQQ
jgi:hypothetical protein